MPSIFDNRVVKGVVKDETGEPLPAVTVVVKGTTNGVTTDMDGEYTLSNVPAGSTLVFSFLGMQTQEIVVRNQKRIDVEMKEDAVSIDEVVVVAFGTQKKESMVSSIETVKPAALKVPSSNLTTALAGRMSGLIAYQRSGEPGQDNADFFIRGVTTFGYKKDPLILIDGIETTSTELARLQPDDIAAFSILKDATATALYGARGANGVIQVQTKEGKEGPAKVSLRVENSFSSNTSNIELADPITYMQMANEAAVTRNPLSPLVYSREKIANTIAGKNPYLYPANDWRKLMTNPLVANQRANLSVSGGGKVARYYIAATFSKDNGNLKNDKYAGYKNNIDLSTYQLRSNVNINLTKTTEAIVRLAGTFDDYTGPLDGGDTMYKKIMVSNPVLFPAYYPSSDLPSAKHVLYGNALYNNGVEYTNGKLARSLVRTFHKNGIIVMLCAGELLVGVAIPHEAVTGRQTLCHKALAHLADQIQLRAGDDSAGLIHHADHAVDRVLHLVDHALKYSIGHKWIPLFLSCANRRWAGL